MLSTWREEDGRGWVSRDSFPTCAGKTLQKYLTNESLTAITFSVSQRVTLIQSVNRGGEGVIEKYVDGGMFLSEIEGGRVYGMYGGI